MTQIPNLDDTTTHTPGDVFSLSDAIVNESAALRPIAATFKGVPGHDGEWDDLSPEGSARALDAFRAFKRRLRALPPPSTRDAELAALIMDDIIEQEISQIEEADPLLMMNSISSSFQMLRMVFDCMDMSTPAGWENVVQRLNTLDVAASGLRATLSSQLTSGHVVAVRQARAALEQSRVHAGEASFFATLPARMALAGVTDPSLTARLAAAVPKARRAFSDLADFIERSYLPHAAPADAVGRDRYLPHARRFLGMTIDPEETYAWGFDQIRTIWSEMQRVAAEILPGAPLPAVLDLLKTDPSRSAKSPEDLVQIITERQSAALSALDGKHFDIPAPLRRFDVRIAPPGGPLGAYYMPPSEDLTRPGTIWYSLGDRRIIPLYGEITTAYHEGFPGHHLQCGTQVTLTNLSRMHRLSDGYSGFAEGWALYAEQLMHELGFLERPDYILGMLAAQITRACRVVIDIGSHLNLPIPPDSPFHPGAHWTFALGTEMLRDIAFLAPDVAASEMTRYLGWPAQAISYKVGHRVLQNLRQTLQRTQGPSFNLRTFHAQLLSYGCIGLQLLQDQMLPQ